MNTEEKTCIRDARSSVFPNAATWSAAHVCHVWRNYFSSNLSEHLF